jgi:dolichol-phosphate mannosyltransferase
MGARDVLVLLPTYNERDNVGRIVRQLTELGLPANILFVDDNSPDGTGQLLDEIAAERTDVHVMHRARKLGIGGAHRDGIRWAYDHGYSILVTMDSDLTHSPGDVSDLLRAATTCDVAVGSRFLLAESLDEWNAFRKTLTLAGHVLTRALLGMTHDATGAFRVYRLDRIPPAVFDLVSSTGYAFFFESLYILSVNGFSIAEVPIRLPARTYGSSKMSGREILRSLGMLISMYAKSLLSPGRFRTGRRATPSVAPTIDWDAYWGRRPSGLRMLYDPVAAFYRRFIIRPLVTDVLRKRLREGAEALHAGCGSGQVDVDIHARVSITALDLSEAALAVYRDTLGRSCRVLRASILEIPCRDRVFDGVYNVGVMEHFTEAEIKVILLEFHRVLKTGGKVLLFWPPEFGSSVVFLKAAGFLLARVLRRPIALHPPEVTRLRTRAQVAALLESAGLTLEEYSFGPRDLFTHVVVVARRP